LFPNNTLFVLNIVNALQKLFLHSRTRMPIFFIDPRRKNVNWPAVRPHGTEACLRLLLSKEVLCTAHAPHWPFIYSVYVCPIFKIKWRDPTSIITTSRSSLLRYDFGYIGHHLNCIWTWITLKLDDFRCLSYIHLHAHLSNHCRL